MPLHWIEEVDGLSSAELTVQAQALSVDDMDELLYPTFFPPTPTDSVELETIFELDKRYVSDRREWNQRGRFIPQDVPELEKLEMVPIESYDKIGEREQQKLRERAFNNEQVYRDIIGASVPDRVDKLVRANFRRVEVDAMEAWAKGTITTQNPQKGTTQSLGLGFGSRVQTAGTAWDDGSTNAYDDLVAWIEDGEAEVGQIVGVVLRRAIYNAIRADAPNPMPGAQSALQPTRSQIEQRLADELGHAFRFYIVENQFDVFDDGGTEVTRTAVWPSQYAAAVPQGIQVGSTYRAPVVRAMELANQFPNAGIDQRGQTVYYEYENGGRTASIECQANHLPLPSERNVWSIDTGVSS